MNFCSHTLVKNGSPFFRLVMEQVIPYANRCLITISDKADEWTTRTALDLEQKYIDKVCVSVESVTEPGQLTQERQKQVTKTHEDWILFLDDDDFWPTESLENIVNNYLHKDVDAYAFNPYQVIDEEHHDCGWRYKWFTKWFKNSHDINYRKPWPRDLIYKGDKMLYWRKNERVPRINVPYYHLSYIKDGSFRKEDWTKGKYELKVSSYKKFPEYCAQDIRKIWTAFQ